jgi:hypothetical protein
VQRFVEHRWVLISLAVVIGVVSSADAAKRLSK